MKKLILMISCLLIVTGMTALPVMAEEMPGTPPVPAPANNGWTVHGSITGGVEYFWEDSGSAKFNEYRYKQSEPWGGFADLDKYVISPDGTHRMDLTVHYRSPQDVDIDLTSRSAGIYKFDFTFQEMGHVFAYDAKTVFTGIGGANLTINPALRSSIQGAVAVTPTTLQSVIDTQAGRTDLLLKRDRIGANLDLNLLSPLYLNLGFTYENRDGSRPYGGALGFGSAVEIAEPINYDTYNANAGLEYADKMIFARANYYHSTFENHIGSVTWDNPFTATGLERNSLAPSNRYDNINGAVGVNLPLRTRVLFIGSYGWLNQNDVLLNPTVNPAVAGVLPNPRAKADAEVETKQFELRMTSSPVDKLSLKANFKYFDHINNTPLDSFTNVTADSFVSGTETPEYNSWISRSAEGEAAYEVLPRTNVGFNYQYLDQTYFFEFSRTERENTEKVFIDTRNLDWLTAKLSFLHADRESQYLDESSDVPLLRKFHMADRDRYMADAIVTVTPIDPVSLSLEYTNDRDRYDMSAFGLQLNKFQTATVDADVKVAKWLALNAFYSFEYNSQSQRNRQWTPGGAGDPALTGIDNPSNWNLRTRAEIHTAGLGADAELVPDFINLKAEGIWSKTHGKALFSSPVGPVSLQDANPFVPQNFNNLDSDEFWRALVVMKVKLTKSISASLGYRYERWTVKDYQRDGLTNVQTNNVGTIGLLNMNTLYQPYEVHSVFTSLTYNF